jgi:hypothetical protein
MPFLIGSTFSLTLIRRYVEIEPTPFEKLQKKLLSENYESFWGHANTIYVANKLLGIDVTPKSNRPAIILNERGYPTLNGNVYKESWVVSPDYREGFRPRIGEEVDAKDIVGWVVLKLSWR